MADRLDFTGFRSDAAERVVQLLLVLNRLNADPFLRPRLCLHGGTALNLFALDMPRLSVDIDVNYIGHADRAKMLAERGDIEQGVMEAGREAGFDVLAGKSEHSGRKFVLRYEGSQGPDQVKVDVDYLNRSPLLPVQAKSVRLATGGEATFPLTSDIELFAGKTKALVERVAVRDLYDSTKIAHAYPALLAAGDETLLRRIMLYYLTVSAPFPRPFEVAARFAGREPEVAAALYPLLLAGDEPALHDMIATAHEFVASVSPPRDDDEAEYLARAAKADFAPELLFADYPDTLAAAKADPAAAWKMQNLAKTL
jgi:predicted nucleotidyltransferase component of viral defense system